MSRAALEEWELADRFWRRAIIALVAAVAVAVIAAIYFGSTWDYRWKAACGRANGVLMHMGDSSHRVCVGGSDVRLITIAVSPW